MFDALLVLSLVSVFVLYWRGNDRFAGIYGMVLYGIMLVLVAFVGSDIGANGSVALSFGVTILGEPLSWRMDGLGWFFSLLTTGAAFFSAWYASGEWGAIQPNKRIQHGTLALNVFTMLVLVSSGDLLSLFIGWELVSWAAFVMMTQLGGVGAKAALRYLIYALAGAMALLAAIVLVHTETGSFGFAAFVDGLPAMSAALKWMLFALFTAGFGVKMAIFPFHLWQADAYSYTPGASASFLGAVSGRIGLFAFTLVVVKLMGPALASGLEVPYLPIDGRTILMWVAAITMVVPTFIALMQTDARKLLAWHGMGQGGYMLLGLLVATPLGTAGGLLHVFNHATYQMALILAVFAVIHRTRTADLDKLGGLITRMPFTYVALLMGIIGLAGLPPMNGFVSKWMVYKSLLNTEQPLLLVAAFVGTLGTILSVYKLIHNIFLGQLRLEHNQIREAPISMVMPMMVLAGIGFVTGFMPGLALDLVDMAQSAIGVAPLAHHLGGMELAQGSLNMLWVVGILIGAIGVGALIFYLLGNRRWEVSQYDNYAGGHFLSADVRYHFSHEFYPGLARVIGPWYRGWIVKAERAITTLVAVGGDMLGGVFRFAHTPFYMLMAVTIGLIWAGYAGGF